MRRNEKDSERAGDMPLSKSAVWGCISGGLFVVFLIAYRFFGHRIAGGLGGDITRIGRLMSLAGWLGFGVAATIVSTLGMRRTNPKRIPRLRGRVYALIGLVLGILGVSLMVLLLLLIKLLSK